MPRTARNLNYLENIEPIKKYLIDSPLEERKIKHSLLATDRVFPFLVNRFKDNIEELNNFDLENFLSIKSRNKINEITKEWDSKNVNNRIFDAWKEKSPETKSNILMKWVNFCVKQEEKKDVNEKKTKENTFLSYMWSFQGLLTNLGRDYEANPKKLQQLKQNGIKLGSDIEYNEVIELFDKLNNDKYKIILKIMMYSGLNPIDIIKLTPNDFKLVNGSTKKKLKESLKNTDFYYIIKERTKTQRRNIYFLLVFAQNFFNEIKSYFERPIIINIKKNGSDKTKEKIEKLRNEKYIVIEKNKKIVKNRYTFEEIGETVRFKGHYYWDYDKNVNIFGKFNPKSSTNVADAFRYCVEKYSLNEHLRPLNIRSLCFTLLKDVFTFKDENIYQLWTQHKVKGVVNRNYITNQLEILINKYLEKIEEIVLIGSLKQTLERANEYKEKVEAVSENSQDIIALKLENSKLLNMLNESNDKFNDLSNTVNQLKDMIMKGDLSFITPLPNVFAKDQEKEAEISRRKHQKAKKIEENLKKP